MAKYEHFGLLKNTCILLLKAMICPQNSKNHKNRLILCVIRPKGVCFQSSATRAQLRYVLIFFFHFYSQTEIGHNFPTNFLKILNIPSLVESKISLAIFRRRRDNFLNFPLSLSHSHFFSLSL